MKKAILFISLILLSLPPIWAYDFEVDNIFYKINTDGTSVSVTYETTDYRSYEGDIIIPEQVSYNNQSYKINSIDERAFYNCPTLTSVNIPGSVITIGKYAFSYCNTLSIVNIPNELTTIDAYAFSYCSALVSINIPQSVTNINGNVFSGCSKLTSIDVDPKNLYYKSSDGILYNHDMSTLIVFPGGKEGDFVIPNTVFTINSYAFSHCSALTSINIPQSVTIIGNFAFYNCSGLKSINVDSGNKKFSSKDGALFSYDMTTLIVCPGGKEGDFIIPNTVSSIKMHAFSYCKALTSVTIPGSVSSIDNPIFRDCSKLNSINVDIENLHFKSSDGVLFNNDMTNLITYPCGREGSYNIPISVCSIGRNAFSYCRALNSVTIPNSVSTINDYAFGYCYSLTSIHSESLTAPSIQEHSFFDVNKNKCYVYVPNGCKNEYVEKWTWPSDMVIEDVSNISNLETEDINIDINHSNIVIENLPKNMMATLYRLNGSIAWQTTGDESRISYNAHAGQIYILKVGSFVKKIIL